jgi:hypothetical protein
MGFIYIAKLLLLVEKVLVSPVGTTLRITLPFSTKPEAK